MQQITIAWDDDQIIVQSDQGQEPVEDIGAALQMVLDAYKRGESEPGEADYMAAFSDNKRTQQPAKQPSDADRAMAMRG